MHGAAAVHGGGHEGGGQGSGEEGSWCWTCVMCPCVCLLRKMEDRIPTIQYEESMIAGMIDCAGEASPQLVREVDPRPPQDGGAEADRVDLADCGAQHIHHHPQHVQEVAPQLAQDGEADRAAKNDTTPDPLSPCPGTEHQPSGQKILTQHVHGGQHHHQLGDVGHGRGHQHDRCVPATISPLLTRTPAAHYVQLRFSFKNIYQSSIFLTSLQTTSSQFRESS